MEVVVGMEAVQPEGRKKVGKKRLMSRALFLLRKAPRLHIIGAQFEKALRMYCTYRTKYLLYHAKFGKAFCTALLRKYVL